MTAPKVDLVKRAISLWKERQALKDKIKKVEAQLEEVGPKALEWMQANTIPSLKQNGTTAYIRREIWACLAEGVTTDFLRDALTAAGFEPGDVIKERANTQTLSSIVREYDQRNESLPNSLATAVKVSEVFRLGFRQSA